MVKQQQKNLQYFYEFNTFKIHFISRYRTSLPMMKK